MAALLSTIRGKHNRVQAAPIRPMVVVDTQKEDKPQAATSTPSTPDTTTESPSLVVWQWEHRTGFRDYNPSVNQRIEDAFQAGLYFVRVKTGKSGTVPMEIFFNDFLQYDPVTTHSRRVRRVGPDTCLQWLWRTVLRKWSQAVEALTDEKAIKQFQDYERHKREILEGIVEKPYAVEDLYHTSGCCASIAKSTSFNFLTFFVILLSAFWIGVETAHYGEEYFNTTRKVVDHIFCTFFTIEILIRFGAFKVKRHCLTDKWFVFDFILAMLMIIETWILQFIFWAAKIDDDASSSMEVVRLLRILKLTRLGRFARLMAAFPELMTLMKGIFHALRSVTFTAILLGIQLYIFAIFFTTQAKVSGGEELKTYFGTWSNSMWILLMAGVFVDGPIEVLNDVKKESPMLTVCFVLFIVISNLTVLNMLIGILCTVVDRVYQREKDNAAVQILQSQMLEALEVHSEDGNQTLRKSEFDMLLRNPEVNLILARFGVDAADLKNLRDGLYNDKYALAALVGVNPRGTETQSITPEEMTPQACGEQSVFNPEEVELTFSEFLAIVLRLRGGNSAKVNDIVELREYMKKIMDRNLRAVKDLSKRSGRVAGCTSSSRTAEAWIHQPELVTASSAPLMPSISERSVGTVSYDSEQFMGPSLTNDQEWEIQATAMPTVEGYESQMLDLMAKLSTGQQQLLARQQELEVKQAAWQKEFMEQQSRVSEQVSTLCMRFQALSLEKVNDSIDSHSKPGEVWC